MPHTLLPTLLERAGERCELCGATQHLDGFDVAPVGEPDPDRAVLACDTCRAQLAGAAPLDPRHWHCLRESAWSEVAAVQVVSWRLLHAMPDESWARELLDQVYLDDETLRWAREGLPESAEDRARTLDSNGAELADGDTVTLVKDLDVKGASFTAKRGTVVKGIRLTGDPEHVEGRVNGIGIVLKTCFLKKAG